MPYTASERIELALMVFEPSEHFPKYLRSVDDVAEHRHLLEMCEYGDFAIEFLIRLVLDRVGESRRKSLIYGLKAIKWQMYNRSAKSPAISTQIVDQLFGLYQRFVFDHVEDIQWCVSAILRDRLLQKDQIRWLVDHYKTSDHIVNRLLRYPVFDPLIADWARDMLRTRKLEDRASELLGRLILQTLPPEVERLDPATILWGIYYSSADRAMKQELLEHCASTKAIDDLITISIRLQMPTVLKKFASQLSNQ